MPSFIHDNKRRKVETKSKINKSFHIGGSSTDDTLINKIVDIVTEKIKSEQKIGKGLDISVPTAELVPNSETAPLPFNNTITKNDDNDLFGKHYKNDKVKN
jgi:hypothetical protein